MNNHETAEYLSREETQTYDKMIQTSEMSKKRKKYNKTKGKNKFLLEIGEMTVDGETHPVCDIGYTNFFYIPDIDAICQRHLTQDNEFTLTDFELLDKAVTTHTGVVEQSPFINSKYVYIRGHQIDRKNLKIDGMKVSMITFDEDYDENAGGKREEWIKAIDTFIDDTKLPKLDTFFWKAYIVDETIAIAFDKNEADGVVIGIETINISTVVEPKEKTKAREERARAFVENMDYRIAMYDKSSFLEMEEVDNLATMRLWKDTLELTAGDINMTHMAKEIGVHKNTLYRLQKEEDPEKFNLYLRAYKCKLFENIIETEMESFI